MHSEKIKQWINEEMTTEWEIIIMKSRLGAMITNRDQRLSTRLDEAGIFSRPKDVEYLCEIISYRFPGCDCINRIQKLMMLSDSNKLK